MTSLGHQQIQRAADALRRRNFDLIYCSPLERALQSAAILGRTLDRGIYVHPLLAETGFCWGEPDKTHHELQTAYPTVTLDPGITDTGWAPAPHETEGESLQRAQNVIQWFLGRYPEEDAHALLVSHGRFGSILIGSLFGVQPCGYSQFGQSNGGISHIELSRGAIWLRFLNHTAHLSEEMIT